MPIVRTQHAMSRAETKLVRELSRGIPFPAARQHAGLSWSKVLVRCLRGRRRVARTTAPPDDPHSLFFLALADARWWTHCNLGPLLNRLVRPIALPRDVPYPAATPRSGSGAVLASPSTA
jgi:hypothetical protein